MTKKFFEKSKEYKDIIFILIIILLILVGTQFFTGVIVWEFLEISILMNILILLSLILIFLGITKKLKITLIITATFAYLIGIINFLLIEIRGMPFVFSDIFSIKTATNVMSDFNVEIGYNFWCSIAIFIIIFLLIFFLNDKEINKNINKKRSAFLGIFFIIGIWISSSSSLYYVTSESDQVYGVLYNFLKSTKNIFLQEPKGYSKEKAEEILNRYNVEKNENSVEEKPNIIVIMNETFADINRIYNLGFEDNISFIKNISDDTKLYSPSYGGSTANCEYEFLTGFSTAFYQDSVPYQQYIKSDLYSIADVMKENGYKTIGMHLYKSSSYNRNYVYRYLGFDEIYFDDSINNIEIQKILNSDENTYQKIIDILENKNEDEKIFDFTVTLQNHLPFDVDFYKLKSDFPEYIREIENFEEKYNEKYYTDNKELNGYLNSVRISDNSLENFLKYLEDYEEKVIVLFFGDHQPGLNDERVDEEKKYLVSYALWSNYELENKKIENISMNYLPVILTDIAKLDIPRHLKFLSDLRETIPVITKKGYMDNDKNWYRLGDKNSKYYELIQEYEYIQYYFMSHDSEK